MKKVIALMAAAALFAGTAMAQQTAPAVTAAPETEQTTPQQNVRKDVLMMKGGVVMELKNGAWGALEKERSLSEGTRVSPNGTVTRKDGTIIVLKEGESIDWNGVWYPAKDGKTPDNTPTPKK